MKRTTKAIIVIATIILLMISTKVNAQTLTINTETLFLREETSTTSDIVELLSYGETYEIIGKEGDWYQIKTKNYTGYVHKDYVIAEEGTIPQEPNNTVEETNTMVEEPQNEIVENKTIVNEIMNSAVSEPEEPKENATEPTQDMGEDTKIMRVSQFTKLRVLPLVHAIVLEELKMDAQVTIMTICNKWAYVETDTQTGWVRLDMLAKVDNEENISHYPTTEEPEQNVPENNEPENEEPIEEMHQVGYVAGTGVNVRSIASTQGEVVEVLNTNAEVTVIGKEGDWYKIRFGDIEGYILASLVSDEEVPVTSRGNSVQREPVVDAKEPQTTMQTSEPLASSKGEDIVAYAKQYLGKPYVYGASGPNSFDCSGFTMYVYQHFGISMSHSANAQSRLGTSVSKEDLQLGDLVFFRDYETGVGIGHVGIYIGGGDFIHASSGSGYCVKISTLISGSYDNRYMSAKRLV